MDKEQALQYVQERLGARASRADAERVFRALRLAGSVSVTATGYVIDPDADLLGAALAARARKHLPGMSRTAAMRATTGRYRVFRSVGQYWVRDLGSTARDVAVPDYWRAREVAIRWRAADALRRMGLDDDEVDAAVVWAIERGCTTVRQIVACAAEEIAE